MFISTEKKMKVTRYWIVVIGIVVCVCAKASTPVSLMQLILSPEKYFGKEIAVKGYLVDDGSYLFLTKDHYIMRDGASGLYVDLGVSKLISSCGGYSQIFASFKRDKEGAYITDISKIISAHSGESCISKKGIIGDTL
jgi:hypothetical protein